MDEKDIHKQEKNLFRYLGIMTIANIILAAGIVIILAVLVPKTLNVVNEAQTALDEARILTASAQESLEKVNVIVESANTMVMDADEMVREADQILADNTGDMELVLDNINSVDFETLNKAINDLSAAVEPLAKLSHALGY